MSLKGFEGSGIAMGSVRGLRAWTFEITEIVVEPDPAEVRVLWDTRSRLVGAYGWGWEQGENVARCAASPYGVSFGAPGSGIPERVPSWHEAPDERCGCGFWAYWRDALMVLASPVAGVIEGYGQTLIGEKGFRCQKARILALCTDWDRDVRNCLSVLYQVPVYSSITVMLEHHEVPAGYP